MSNDCAHALQAVAEGSPVCVPCLFFFFVVLAGFAGLVAGSLYYGGATLQSMWALGKQRGLGLREVALQGFKRAEVDKKDGAEANGAHETSVDVGISDQETQRLIPQEQ